MLQSYCWPQLTLFTLVFWAFETKVHQSAIEATAGPARIIDHIGRGRIGAKQFTIIDLVFAERPRNQSIPGTRTTVTTAKQLCTYQLANDRLRAGKAKYGHNETTNY